MHGVGIRGYARIYLLLRSGQIRVSTSIKPRMPKRELDVPLDATLPCLVKSQLAHWRRKHEPR